MIACAKSYKRYTLYSMKHLQWSCFSKKPQSKMFNKVLYASLKKSSNVFFSRYQSGIFFHFFLSLRVNQDVFSLKDCFKLKRLGKRYLRSLNIYKFPIWVSIFQAFPGKKSIVVLSCNQDIISANIYLFKVSNRNSRKRCDICSNLTLKRSDRLQWSRCDVFINDFKHMWHLFLVLVLFAFNK